jgi:predicted deacylase
VRVPVYVWRGERDGPTVFVTAAVHGDEINGTGTIRHILRERPFELEGGTLVLVPVVNLPGLRAHTRYLPDRRDLNRSFPGSRDGSFASRVAHARLRAGHPSLRLRDRPAHRGGAPDELPERACRHGEPERSRRSPAPSGPS